MSFKLRDKQVTAVIPHYKTLDLTRYCLDSLKKYTDLANLRVLIVDNASRDASIDYLKGLSWIHLLERKPVAGESPSQAHARALDLGLSHTKTPYLLSLHTDTIILSAGWLSFLIRQIEKDPRVAGVGSWKLEQKPFLKKLAKQLERFWETRIWFPLTGKGEGRVSGRGRNYYYLRSHCALYKTDLIREHAQGFSDQNETAGKVLHQKLVNKGFQMAFIPSRILSRYMCHLNHATMIINPELCGPKGPSRKAYRRLYKTLKRLDREDLLPGI